MGQVIISISREYGSGGHHIAEELAERLQLPMYDHDLLDHIAEEKGMDLQGLHKYDESKRKLFIHRTVRGMNNSPEDAVAQIQFDFMREKAKSGESFIIVGRCAETVLGEYACLIPFFVCGDREEKIARIMEVRSMSRKDAIAAIKRHDKKRREYHNQYSKGRWGDARYYEMCINSSKLGVERTADIVENYIRQRMEEL